MEPTRHLKLWITLKYAYKRDDLGLGVKKLIKNNALANKT